MKWQKKLKKKKLLPTEQESNASLVTAYEFVRVANTFQENVDWVAAKSELNSWTDWLDPLRPVACKPQDKHCRAIKTNSHHFKSSKQITQEENRRTASSG